MILKIKYRGYEFLLKITLVDLIKNLFRKRLFVIELEKTRCNHSISCVKISKYVRGYMTENLMCDLKVKTNHSVEYERERLK